MKKVGIITIHYNGNYGAVLQTYALQTAILNSGCDCEIINYAPNHSNDQLHIFTKSIFRTIRNILNCKNVISRIISFKKFFKEKYRLSGKRIKTPAELNSINFNYDLFITGSDQTFNPLIYNDISLSMPYMLSFTDSANKYSYASSSGEHTSELSPDLKQHLYNQLSKYKYVTVREASTVSFLESIGIKNAKTVIDPTLLLTNEQWSLIKEPVKYKKNSYILFYSVLSAPWIVEAIKDLSKKTGLKILAVHYKNSHELKTNFERVSYSSPGQFLSLIENAALVCTTSFHGTVFSVLGNIPFLSFIDGPGKRIKNLLMQLNLEDRIIDQNNKNKIPELTIDFSESNNRLAMLRNASLRELYVILNETEK